MELAGFSIAGMETCIEVPSLKLLLDLGRCSKTAVSSPLALVSHGHIDHVGAVAHHAARRAMMHMDEGVYVVPRQVAPQVEALFNAAGELDGQPIPRRVVPLAPGEELALTKNRFVRAFETFHRVASQGYTVWERRHRLRPEFRQLEGPRLGELRKKGVLIDESYEMPVLSFTGDTRVEVLERTPELQHTQTLVIESTFLDERVTVEGAREMGHIHLDELLVRSELLPKTEVVLSHFSARYDDREVRQLIEHRLPDALRATVRHLPNEPVLA
ncbi:MAG TPA: MBL fold metallo-hydrolase [Labilithrix sp.]|nr:MBL fold metallo-hydrolase [Labilithrix sp.]